MAGTSDSSAKAGCASPPGPATGRARADRLGLLKRFLTLREGSIIVVTLIAVIYFASSTPAFFTGANFKTLLPSSPPFGIGGGGLLLVMPRGETALWVGALSFSPPF